MPFVFITHATFDSQAIAANAHAHVKSLAVNASVAHIGDPEAERTSHAMVAEEQLDGSLVVVASWHVDLFGIVRDGEPDLNEPPAWIQPLGAHDAYPAQNVRGEETRVTHASKMWRNVHGNANTWEPGVFGWEEVTE